MAFWNRFWQQWKHPDAAVRRNVVEQLEDETILRTVAENDKDPHVRAAAIKRVCDEDLLKAIATENTHPAPRVAAIERIKDETFLRTLLQDRDSSVRTAVVGKLSDQQLLQSIVKQDASCSVRWYAVKKLTDELFLQMVATNDSDQGVRAAAAARLTDTNFLRTLATEAASEMVREAAADCLVKQMSDEELLHAVDTENLGERFRLIATSKLSNCTNAVVRFAFRMKDPDPLARIETVQVLAHSGDPRAFEVLKQVYQNRNEFGGIREAALDAVEHINPQWRPNVPGVGQLERYAGQLFALCDAVHSRFPTGSDGPARVKEIGRQLHELGGFELMWLTHRHFRKTGPFTTRAADKEAARTLEVLWNEIGEWRS